MSYADNIGSFGCDRAFSEEIISKVSGKKWMGFYNNRQNGVIFIMGNSANCSLPTNGLEIEFKNGQMVSMKSYGIDVTDKYECIVDRADKFCGYPYTVIVENNRGEL